MTCRSPAQFFFVVDVVVAVPEIANNIPPPMNICSQKTESMKKPLFSPLIHFKNLYIRNVYFFVCLFFMYVETETDDFMDLIFERTSTFELLTLLLLKN